MRACVRVFDTALNVMAAALVGVLLVVVTAGMVSRGFNRPLAYTDELAGYVMVWLSCFGWMIATRRSAHIRVLYFANLLKGRFRPILDVALSAAVLVFGVVLAWTAVHQVRVNSDVEAIALPIPTGWLYVPLIPAGIVTALQALADLIASLHAKGASRSEAQP